MNECLAAHPCVWVVPFWCLWLLSGLLSLLIFFKEGQRKLGSQCPFFLAVLAVPSLLLCGWVSLIAVGFVMTTMPEPIPPKGLG
jgi:hypothetical protein